MSSLLLQAAKEFIHHHFFQLPTNTASNQGKGKQKQEQCPWSISGSSLLCLKSAPSLICSLSGWEEPQLRLQICDSSRHKPGIHCILAAVPQQDDRTLQGKHLKTQPVEPRFTQDYTCPHWSGARSLWRAMPHVSSIKWKQPVWLPLGQVMQIDYL